MNDYFFIASLPMIRSDEEPQFTVAEFVERCRERLTSSDMATLEALLEDRPSHDSFAAAWYQADTQVRNAVARLRAARRNIDPSGWLRSHEGYDLSIIEAVEAAFRQQDPWAREQSLNGLRHRIIDDLLGPSNFTREAVLGYGLKLRLAWQLRRFDPQAGKQKLADALQGVELPQPDDSGHDRETAENGKTSE